MHKYKLGGKSVEEFCDKNSKPRANDIPVELEGHMDRQGPALLLGEFEKG